MTCLTLSRLRLHLVPERTLHLPAHNKGNSLRGGFGAAFRRLVCVDLSWECADCTLRYTCPYTKVFNPFIPPDATQFTGNQNIPRPFVVKPPLTTQTAYAAGEPLVFELVVAGSAIDYLPYFIVSFRELGATGFGLNRARVQLARVEAIGADGTTTIVYDASTNVVRPAAPLVMEVAAAGLQEEKTMVRRRDISSPHPDPLPEGEGEERQPTASISDCRVPATECVTLEFLTPTTLKAGSTADRNGMIVRRPAFHHVLKRLRDRVNALSTFYGNGALDLDFKALGAAAEQIETVDDQTRWVERSRVSRRRPEVAGSRYSVAGTADQKSSDYRLPNTDYALRQHDLSGFVGPVTFRGHLTPFLPLLRVGEYVHVGKNAVFGNGWFVVRNVAGHR